MRRSCAPAPVTGMECRDGLFWGVDISRNNQCRRGYTPYTVPIRAIVVTCLALDKSESESSPQLLSVCQLAELESELNSCTELTSSPLVIAIIVVVTAIAILMATVCQLLLRPFSLWMLWSPLCSQAGHHLFPQLPGAGQVTSLY